MAMTKREMIEDIMRLNRSATAEFLAIFDENELWMYLQRLLSLKSQSRTGAVLTPLTPQEVAEL